MDFSKKQIDILKFVAVEVESKITESRKGVPQGYYVIEVKSNTEYWDDDKLDLLTVPKELVGNWKMIFLDDIDDYCWQDCLSRSGWYKVEKKEFLSYEWV
jgi:hypothetical protein